VKGFFTNRAMLRSAIYIKPIHLVLICIFLAGLGYLDNSFASDQPQERIKATADKLLLSIHENKSKYEKNEDLLFNFVDQTLSPILDFDALTKQILGRKYYSKASEEQRLEFSEALKWQLIRLYAKTILQHSHARIGYLPEAEKRTGKIRFVRTELYLGGGQRPFKVDYAMRQTQGEWKIVEVVANGIRLVKSLRNTFQPEIEQTGLTAVIKRLNATQVID